MQSKYFYKLGHVPELATEEFLGLTGTDPQTIQNDANYLLSDTELDVNLSGSLVLGGQILASTLKQSDTGQKWFLDEIESYLQENPTRKLGIAVPKSVNQKVLYKIAKQAGVKQLTIVTDYPNYGYYKKVKNWLLAFESSGRMVLGRLSTYFDQEFWAKIDTSLPAGDMKRGLINLKLARSLNNLTKCANIWDPFCGSGRNLVSALNIKDSFVCSDIDEVCRQQVQSNYDFLQKTQEAFRPTLLDNFTTNASSFALPKALDLRYKTDGSKLAVVTEGSLGSNSGKKIVQEQMSQEYQELQSVWSGFLTGLNSIDYISEVIFCLPYYVYAPEKSNAYFDQIINGLQECGWKVRPFYNRSKYIIYSRPSTLVAHGILRFDKEQT